MQVTKVNSVIVAVMCLLLGLTTLPSRALLDFYFTTPAGGNPGDTVSGYLLGLNNGLNQDPTQILITQAPAYLGITASPITPYYLNVTTYLSSSGGSFVSTTTPGVYGFNISLVGGVETITLPLDLAFEDASGNGIGFNVFSNSFGTGYNGALFNGVGDYSQSGFAGVTFTPVPEPQDYAFAFLLGVAILIGCRKIREAWVRTKPPKG